MAVAHCLINTTDNYYCSIFLISFSRYGTYSFLKNERDKLKQKNQNVIIMRMYFEVDRSEF